MNAVAQKEKVRVMLWRMVAGAIVGAVGTGLFLVFVGEPNMDLDDPGVMLAIVSGLSYVLIGLIVGVGLLSPSTGAKFLNVEDAEEIREETPKLWISALCCVLVGILLMALAMSGGLISGQAALIVASVCFAGILIIGLLSAKRYDELTRQIGLEASAGAFYTTLLLVGGWAGLAHLGYVAWISPLAFVSGISLLLLVAIFVVAAQRGLMLR